MSRRDRADLPAVIEWVLDEIRMIDESDAEQKMKTRSHKRLAAKVRTRLTDDQRLKDGDRLAPSTLRRYITTVRKAITDQNWKHHGLDTQIDRMARKHARYADEIRALGDIADISELRITHRDLANRVRQAGDGEAYHDLTAMKLDHEIMRHLTLPQIHKATLAASHVEALEKRATNTVNLSYRHIVETIGTLMNSRQQLDDGSWGPVRSHMALALALATGRREWEVLVLGRFKKAGEYELEFSGAAKKRGGVDYSETYRIYTLIAADQVLAAMEALRSLPDVVELQSLDNRQFSLRVASSLNRAARQYLGDERVFKDSRAIWARIVFDLHFKVDRRWAKTNETVFWREQLGHEDMDTQESYKAFKIDYSGMADDDQPAAGGYRSRIEALEALDEHEQILKRESMQKIHAWVKGQIREYPEAPITQSLITREVGSGRQVIKDYLALADDALNTANRETVINAYTPTAAAAVSLPKPRINARRLADGRFEAVAIVNGEEVAREVGDDRMSAMRYAFDAATTLRK